MPLCGGHTARGGGNSGDRGEGEEEGMGGGFQTKKSTGSSQWVSM